MQLPKQLYAPSLKERWNITQEWLKDKPKLKGEPLVEIDNVTYIKEQDWPDACFGSANSWLLVVGPSPGESEPKDLSEYEKLKPALCVGAPHRGFTFQDGSGYFKKIRELIDNFFRALNFPGLGRSLAHHANLLEKKAVPQPPRYQLFSAHAMERITRVFRETHPQCIIALTGDVFDVLQELLEQLSYTRVKPPYELDFAYFKGERQEAFHRRWELRELKNNDKILLARIHQHPTKPYFKYCLSKFVTELAKISREELNAGP